MNNFLELTDFEILEDIIDFYNNLLDVCSNILNQENLSKESRIIYEKQQKETKAIKENLLKKFDYVRQNKDDYFKFLLKNKTILEIEKVIEEITKIRDLKIENKKKEVLENDISKEEYIKLEKEFVQKYI